MEFIALPYVKMKQVAYLFSLLFTFGLAQGQSIISFAPWEFGAEFLSDSKYDLLEPFISIKRVVPLSSLLPQVTGDSYVQALTILVGSRITNSKAEHIRFRITAVKLALQRAYTSGGFTLLDFNRTGLIDEQTTWIGASFGPGIHVKNDDVGAWARVSAEGQLTSQKPGGLLFSGMEDATVLKTGFAYKVSAEAGVLLRKKLRVDVSYELERFSKANLDHREWLAMASFRFNPRYAASLGYQTGEFEFANITKQFSGLMGAFRFTPSASPF